MPKTVSINNIGTIKELTFDLPDNSGGVLVLKGRNRIGKSTAIRVLRALLSGNGRGLPVRDKAVRGSAEAFGKRASVSNQVRMTGDLAVESLEGKFDFSDLVHPEAVEPETRDRIRIKALLSLTGAAADATLFYPLVGGQEAFEKLVPADSIKKKDLVELAALVHRALHAAAKQKEGEAEFAAGHAHACKEAAGPDAKPGEVQLQPLHDASNQAAAAMAAIQERSTQAVMSQQRVATTEKAIAEAERQYTGLSVKAASDVEANAVANTGHCEAEVKRLAAALDEAKQRLADAKRCEDDATKARLHAVQFEEGLANLRKILKQNQAALSNIPSEEETQRAYAAAQQARAALEAGIKARDASMKLLEAQAHERTAERLAQEAETLREKARSVDQVLSERLPPGPLRAEGGRLVLDTERGEGAPYDECSMGEKWTHALPYGIRAVGAGGVIAVVQEAWDGLDDSNRHLIADAAKEGKAWIITAEVDSGELRAEVYG